MTNPNPNPNTLSDWEVEWDAYSREAHRTQAKYDKAHMAYLTAIQLHRPQAELDALLQAVKDSSEECAVAIRATPRG